MTTTRHTDWARYGMWLGIVATAHANRRHYQMTTTWLPHLASNTVSLLLPDVYRFLDGIVPSADALPADLATLRTSLDTLIRDSPRYANYVAPLAFGYLTSHPRFNIYKGKLGQLQLAGFGLDAIPHTSTAYALTRLIHATLAEMSSHAHDTPFGNLLRTLARHPQLISALTLMCVTAAWEWGEYRIHAQELAEKGNAENINMQWSVPDMVTDSLSNAIGWLIAVWQPSS